MARAEIAINVIKPGSEVRLWNNVPAKVIAMMLESRDRISYRVVYWNGSRLEHDWIDNCCILHTEEYPRSLIGYKQ